MEKIRKRIVFHLYVKEGWNTLLSNQIHFLCLRHYGHLFDDAIFIISLDDVNNNELITEVQLKLLTLNLPLNIEFKITKNNHFREAETFKQEIVEKLGEYDGLTFFAHGKGMTNLDICTKEQVILWVSALYFFSLEYIEEMEYILTEGRQFSYGPLLVSIDEQTLGEEYFLPSFPREKFLERTKMTLGKYRYFYMGTFFWLNEKTIKEYIEKNNLKLPLFSDRWYAENFFSNIFPLSFALSHKGIYGVNYINGGSDIETLTQQIASEEEYVKLCEFNNFIKDSIVW